MFFVSCDFCDVFVMIKHSYFSVARNVAPRMGQNGRLVAVPVGKDRGGGKARDSDTSSFTRRLSTANTNMLEHVEHLEHPGEP